MNEYFGFIYLYIQRETSFFFFIYRETERESDYFFFFMPSDLERQPAMTYTSIYIWIITLLLVVYYSMYIYNVLDRMEAAS